MFLSVVPPDVLNGKPCAGCTSSSVLTTPTLTPSTPPTLHPPSWPKRPFSVGPVPSFPQELLLLWVAVLGEALLQGPCLDASFRLPTFHLSSRPTWSLPLSGCAALIGGYLWRTCWGGNGGRGERGGWGVGGWKRRIIRLRFGLSTFWQSINLWGRSVPASSTFTSTSTSASAERLWPKPSTRIRKCWEKTNEEVECGKWRKLAEIAPQHSTAQALSTETFWYRTGGGSVLIWEDYFVFDL